MYHAKLGTVLFAQLHIIIETYKKTSSPPTSAPFMSLSTSFSVDILLMQTKKATERSGKEQLEIKLKAIKMY
jgi:hypothetical protein